MASFVMDMSTYAVEREERMAESAKEMEGYDCSLQLGLQQIGAVVQKERVTLPLTLASMDAEDFLRSMEACSR